MFVCATLRISIYLVHAHGMTKQSNKVERGELTPLVTLQRAQKQACKRMLGRIDRDGGGGCFVYI